MSSCDLCIVGGGPAGAFLAVLARRSGRSVVLVSGGRNGRPRSETLGPEATRLLDEARLSDCLRASGGIPSSGSVDGWSRPAAPVRHAAIASPWGPAWHVDRSRFDAALREAARSLGVTVMTAQAEAASRSSDGFRVMGRSFAVTCHELVDATGCAARIAGLLGVRRTIVDRQFVLFVVLDRTMPEPALHVVTFEDGWVYVSPQGKHGTQVAAVTDLEVLRARGPRGTMLRALRAMHLDVSGSELARVRGACSLSQVVHGLHPTGFSTIGDAAWTPDPLSGHGVARALVSAARWASGTSGGEPSRARQMLAHLRSRSDFMDSTPSSDAPYYRRRARAWRQAEEVLHGDPVEVDEGAETGGSRSHCLRGEGRRVADRAS